MVPTSSRLACWFKADAGTYKDASQSTPAIVDADPVGAWADQSGNGFNALQVANVNRPTLVLNQLNALPAIGFASASRQFLSLGSVLGKPRSWSIFAVMATASPSVTQSPHGSVGGGGGTADAWGNAVISQGGCPSNSCAPDFGDGSNYSQVFTGSGMWTANAFNLMSYVHKDNDVAVQVFKSGAQQSTTTKVSGPRQCIGPVFNFSLGREGDYDGIYLNGMIAEFILYDVNLLPVDRASVEAYLKSKWGF